MSLTNDDVEDILAMLDGARFGEVHLKTASFSLSLRRGDTGQWTQELTVSRSPSQDSGVPVEARDEESKPDSGETDGSLIVVTSPQLGTYYRAPKPGAPPYVEIGSEVDIETVVGLIETMKLMNSVYAGCKGRVREICIADGQFVEAGTPVLRVEPTA